jgi:hypothetical protein
LSLFLILLVSILLRNLIVQNLVVAFGIFHFPLKINICIHFCKSSPYSFILTHCLEFSWLVESDFFEICLRLFLKKFLVFFVNVYLNFGFCISKIVCWFSIIRSRVRSWRLSITGFRRSVRWFYTNIFIIASFLRLIA